ncbi:MAG: hypothetical protein IJ711_07405 [Lachnospiraceae bacterium]|nr:hypothetical protein [Lachnospiraceae bacterium]
MENKKKEYHIHIHYTVQEDTIDEIVPVTEKQYREYRHLEWNEARQRERDSRCMVPTKTGRLKRCIADCSKCDKFRSGTPLSMEKMKEDGMDTPNQNADIEEALMYKELLSALTDALDELDPDKRAIAQAIMDGKKNKDAAEDLGYAAASTYNYQKRQLLASLRERLEKYR